MSPDRSYGHRLPDQSKPIPPPLRRRTSWRIDHFLFSVFLCLLLVAQILGNWSFLVTPAYAESQGTRPSAPASMTFQKFLHEGRQDKVYHGPLIRPQHVPAPPGPTHGQTHTADYAHRPPSAEPATMKPINAPLTAAFLSGQKGTPALDLLGSDGRLEVQLQPGSLDLSHATVPGGKPPAGTLTLRVSQLYGHYASAFNELGTYQVQLVDSQGQVVSGVRLHTPLILIYHYQPSEVAALSLDPAHLFMTWPLLIATATKAHKPTTGLIIALQNNAAAHTVTATSGVFDPSPFTMGDGESPNQGPPPLHLASVQGNAGQLTYSYPLQVAPGTGGFAPQLTLSYSSSDPNERHSATSPANDVGDGWSLTLGSISADTYPNTGTTWYFLGGVANVADRLIPNGSLYDTEHLSYLRIQQETSSQTGQPCFQVWDKPGTYYELGCTSDSLQYWNDSNGRHNYRWDVNKIIAPNEGPNAGTYKMLTVSYLQDVVTSGGYTSIRDAVMKQIVYGTGNSNVVTNVAGTVDFTYKAPFNSAPWASAYGTNYNCSSAPPINTSLRCDDPVQMPGSGKFPVPTVMSTFSLQTVTSYVGSDSNYKDYSYSFSYTDNPFQSCNDPVTLLPGYCAREHLLMSITPTVYQNNTGHALPQVIFGYTNPLQNTYYDSTHQVGNPPQQFYNQTWWQYLNFYRDVDTGVGGQITYATAYNNAHGTPNGVDQHGNPDDRYDPLYCTTHTDCTGNYAHPDDNAWAEQVVTQITAWSQDSSSSSLQRATTSYSYRLAKTGTWDGKTTWCYPAGSDQDCVGDNWLPPGDSDWADYSHDEYQGFNQVYITSPANDLTVDSYYSTEGWKTPGSDYQNFEGASLYEEDMYSGNSPTTTALLSTTTDTYANNSNACRSTSQTYPACETVLVSSKTTQYERTGSSSAPWVQDAYTYDDYNNGLQTGHVYHNLTQEVVTSSNAPTLTKKWSYTTNDQLVGQWTYYTVDKVTHSEIDDNTGHVWQCQDTTYDEGAPSGTQTPSAGWATTVKTYTTCGNSGTAITSYQGYDAYGNLVATVDGVATSHSSFYSNNGCSLPNGLLNIFTSSSNWGQSHYTACTTYDSSYNAQSATISNALGQQSSIGYDNTQGELATSATDINGQTTSTSYSYDNNGNSTVSETDPLETNGYTKQTSEKSSCAWNSTLPCFEIDEHSSQYPNTTVPFRAKMW